MNEFYSGPSAALMHHAIIIFLSSPFTAVHPGRPPHCAVPHARRALARAPFADGGRHSWWWHWWWWHWWGGCPPAHLATEVAAVGARQKDVAGAHLWEKNRATGPEGVGGEAPRLQWLGFAAGVAAGRPREVHTDP